MILSFVSEHFHLEQRIKYDKLIKSDYDSSNNPYLLQCTTHTSLKYHRGIMKYIVSVSKTYIHRGNHKHKSDTKKRWHIYYYEDDIFKTERVNFLQAIYYMTQKRKRIKLYCQNCGNLFLGLVKSRREKLECPNCEPEAGENE